MHAGLKWLDRDLDKTDAKVSEYETNLLSFLAGARGFENGLARIWNHVLKACSALSGFHHGLIIAVHFLCVPNGARAGTSQVAYQTVGHLVSTRKAHLLSNWHSVR